MLFNSMDLYGSIFTNFSKYFFYIMLLGFIYQLAVLLNEKCYKSPFSLFIKVACFALIIRMIYYSYGDYTEQINYINELKTGHFSVAIGSVTDYNDVLSSEKDEVTFKVKELNNKVTSFAIKDYNRFSLGLDPEYFDYTYKMIVYKDSNILDTFDFKKENFNDLTYEEIISFIKNDYAKRHLNTDFALDKFLKTSSYNDGEFSMSLGLILLPFFLFFFYVNWKRRRDIKKILDRLESNQ